jgi:hypothetical protein
MSIEVTLVAKENIELGLTEKAVFTLSNVTATIPVPGPKGDKGDTGATGPQGPQGLPGTGVNSTDDVPEGVNHLYYTEERVEAVIAVTPPAAHTHSDATTSVSGFMSATDKTKLEGIASGAEVNVNADWNASSGDAQILNKPTIVSSIAATAPLTSSGGTTPTISTSIATNKLVGRSSAGTGVMEEISIGTGLELVGSTLNSTAIVDYTSIVKHTVKNDGTATIAKGTPVYSTGSDGTNILVAKASNASESTSSKTMGLVQSQLTTTGGSQTGFVITEGLLSGIDTSAANAGDPVWLGVDGALIYGLINKPYAPAHLVFLGIVTKKSAGNGEIFVKVQNGFELQEIHNVDLITTTPINGHILGYNGTLWVNKTIAGWLGFTPENVANKSDSYTTSSSTTYATTKALVDGLGTKVNSSLVGANNGIAQLDNSGRVPSAQLPSYVDDVVEVANYAALPGTGESGKIYVTLDTNLTYRWTGSVYTEISQSLALGTTSSTAFRGDFGNTAYTHSQALGNPHGATTADISDSTNKRYVTDAQLTVLGNTSGTNTGDETNATIKTKLGAATSLADGYLTAANWSTFNGKQNALTLGNLTEATSSVLTITGGTGAVIGGTTIQVKQSSSSQSGFLSSGDWTTFNNKQGAITLTTTGTSGAATLVGNTLNIPQYAGTTYTFSTGLTNSAGTVTANLSVGVNNGQSVIGGARASENLTLSSTSNATKGAIIFGTSEYDEANNRLGIQQLTPTSKIHLNHNQAGVTQSDANGILLANSTAAALDTQAISPGIVWQGNGWGTTASASTDVRFMIDMLPVQGTTASGTLRIRSNVASAGYNDRFVVTSDGNVGIKTSSPVQILHLTNDTTQGAFVRLDAITGSPGFMTYRANGTLASPTAPVTNDFIGLWSMRGHNGTSYVTGARAYMAGRASENWNTTNNGTELLFATTPNASTTNAIRLLIANDGTITFSDACNLAVGTTTGTKIGTATSQKLAFWNKTPIVQPTTGITGATRVGGGGTTVTDTDTFGGYTLAKIAQALIDIGILA